MSCGTRNRSRHELCATTSGLVAAEQKLFRFYMSMASPEAHYYVQQGVLHTKHEMYFHTFYQTNRCYCCCCSTIDSIFQIEFQHNEKFLCKVYLTIKLNWASMVWHTMWRHHATTITADTVAGRLILRLGLHARR